MGGSYYFVLKKKYIYIYIVFLHYNGWCWYFIKIYFKDVNILTAEQKKGNLTTSDNIPDSNHGRPVQRQQLLIDSCSYMKIHQTDKYLWQYLGVRIDKLVFRPKKAKRAPPPARRQREHDRRRPRQGRKSREW